MAKSYGQSFYKGFFIYHMMDGGAWWYEICRESGESVENCDSEMECHSIIDKMRGE